MIVVEINKVAAFNDHNVLHVIVQESMVKVVGAVSRVDDQFRRLIFTDYQRHQLYEDDHGGGERDDDEEEESSHFRAFSCGLCW